MQDHGGGGEAPSSRAGPVVLANGHHRPPALVLNAHLYELDERDRISSLPDDVMRLIVHMLPIMDAGRTPMLSRKWRDLWYGMLSPNGR
jgi:hypothetical protein